VVDRSQPGERAAAEARGILRVVRALRAHEHRTAAGVFALLVLAYLWPVLVGGKALTPTSLLYQTPPWKQLEAPGVRDALNPQLGDAIALYYPWDALARRLLHAGTFPAWNPYALAGTPLWGNFQVAWLSPFSLPLWLLSLNYGLGLAAAIKLWLAGFGTYLLARELRLSFWPALVAGISFTLCAFNVVWLSHGVFVSAAAMLPWGLLLVERLVRRGRPADGLALVAVAAVIQTAGHPGTQLHVMSALVLYAVVRAGTVRDVERRQLLGRLGLVAVGLGLGSLLSAAVLLPAQATSGEAIGIDVREHHRSIFPGSSMPLHVLRTALFPEWWGRTSETLTSHGPANYRERTFYAGSIPLLLAAIALVSPGAWRRKAPFAVLAALGALIAVHTPLQSAVYRLPVFNGVQNQRMLLWFVLAIALLAGFGLQRVLEAPRQGRSWAVLAVAALLGVVAALGAAGGEASLGTVVRHVLKRSGDPPADVLALVSAVWWLVLVGAGAALLLLIRRRARAGTALLALVVALDMLHFAHGYQSTIPRSATVPPVTPAIAFLQRHASEGRIAAFGEVLSADFTTVYGLRDVRGLDVPQPTKRYDHLWVRVTPRDDHREISEMTEQGPKVLGLLGVRYVVADPQWQTPIPGFAPIYSGDDAIVFRNRFAVPRAEVVSGIRAASGIREEVAAIADRSFDLRSDAVVRSAQLGGEPLPHGSSATAAGTVRVTSEANASVTLRASLARRGLVLLDDAWAPGWTVRVDGRPARALTTDVVLRGVIVPAGAHTIVWSYRVPGLRAGAALSGLGVLLSLAWAGWLLLRRRGRSRGR